MPYKNYYSLTKIAVPVLPASDERQKQMADEGVFEGAHDNDAYGKLSAREMKGLSEIYNMLPPTFPFFVLGSPKGNKQLGLSAVKPEFIVNLDGKEYYFYDYNYRQKKGEKVPDYVMLIDITKGSPTFGKPIKMGPEVLTRLEQAEDSRRQDTADRANKAIELMNHKVSRWAKLKLNVSALPLVIDRTQKTITKRMAEISGQLQSTQNKDKNPNFSTNAYQGRLEDIKKALLSGQFTNQSGTLEAVTPQDAADSLLFLYNGNPDGLLNALKAGTVPVKRELMAQIGPMIQDVAQSRALKDKATLDKRVDTQENRRENVFNPVADPSAPPVLDVTKQKFGPVNKGMLPQGFISKMQKYKTPDDSAGQAYAMGISLNDELSFLQESHNNLEQVHEQIIKHRGKLTTEWLRSMPGQKAVAAMQRFKQSSQAFLRKYQESIVKDGTINPKMFGAKGKMANVNVVVELGVAYMAIDNALSQLTASTTPKEVPGGSPEMASKIMEEADNSNDKLYDKRFRAEDKQLPLF